MTSEEVSGYAAAFVPGLELSRRFWGDVVRPIVDELLPGVARAAALIGAGSDVLGYDTVRSTDHGWGPRVLVFLEDGAGLSNERQLSLFAQVDGRLPATFGGYATRFVARERDPVRHQVTFATVGDWFSTTLGFDPRGDVGPIDWLAAPSQLLLSATAGAVFEDDANLLTDARAGLGWYPEDVWLYLLACQWRRVDQEEPFVGRTGEVGDDLGSALLTARLVRDLMRLCFLIERKYAPYAKWLGTAFGRLACAATLTPSFRAALSASGWEEREAALVPAFESIGRSFNELGIAECQEPVVRPFHDRPFLVLGSGRFADACMAKTSLARFGWAGGIDQFADSTDVLSNPGTAQRLRRFIAGGA